MSRRAVGQNGDRIEQEDEHFRRQVADAYRLLAETFPQRIEAVDGSRPPEDIAKESLWTRFEKVSEQPEAKRLLRAALDDGLAHAYLFHGPPGVGKREMATAFAAELLGDAARVERGSHPDLYVLEPLGDQIRIDAIRGLRHDLHMRPFEADRRVYFDLRRALDERGGSGRAAEGSRGAARLRRDRAGRRRARVAAGDDPFALPARPVPAALGTDGPRVDR